MTVSYGRSNERQGEHEGGHGQADVVDSTKAATTDETSSSSYATVEDSSNRSSTGARGWSGNGLARVLTNK